MLTQAEIERQILAIGDELEAETDRYDEIARQSAEAEADYKERAARAHVSLADSQTKMTVADRAARVDVFCRDEFRAWKILDASRASSREAMLSYRARLDALRTLAANVRHQT